MQKRIKKRNGVATEEPQNKKKSHDEEMVKLIKTLKRDKYPVVEQLKKLFAKSLPD